MAKDDVDIIFLLLYFGYTLPFFHHTAQPMYASFSVSSTFDHTLGFNPGDTESYK